MISINIIFHIIIMNPVKTINDVSFPQEFEDITELVFSNRPSLKSDKLHGKTIRGKDQRHLKQAEIEIDVWRHHESLDDRTYLIGLTEIDKFLNINDSTATLGRAQRWDTVFNRLIANSDCIKSHQYNNQYGRNYQFKLEIPITQTIAISEELDTTHTSKTASCSKQWFKWGSKIYDPQLLYTLKNDVGYDFGLWGTGKYENRPQVKDQHDLKVKNINKRLINDSSVYEYRFTSVCQISNLSLRGEYPAISSFPRDFQPKTKSYYTKRTHQIRKNRNAGKSSLTIVTNSDELGWVTKFRLDYFNLAQRKWFTLGLYDGNNDAIH
jgi:hypothetical protein